jgi:aminoglycoside phosphotransferase (APT) family kinase protein
VDSLSIQDTIALRDHLRLAGLATADTLETSLIRGGRSNLTYQLEVDDKTWILRRPPLGDLPASAHDINREFTVMTALAGSRVPVPRMITYCEDPAVLGAPFVIMERVPGDVLRTDADVLELKPEDRRALFEALVDTLSALHALDPAKVGLQSFGRPIGFMERQVRTWSRQLAAVQIRHIDNIDALASTLADSVPPDSGASIVHGDYRIDNCIVHGSEISAVVDWEMSALGDPRADLATFAVYQQGLAGFPNSVVNSPGLLPGVPRFDELLARYRDARCDDLANFNWYVGFAWFKLAVILAGVDSRVVNGTTIGVTNAGVRSLIDVAVEQSRAALAGSGV